MMKGSRLSRRDVLKVVAASAALPVGVLGLRASAGRLSPAQWHGETLGAVAAMTLWHRDEKFAQRTLARMRGEVERLELIFSLYRPNSGIVRLNRDGRIASPSPELVAVLDESRRIAAASAGAFDPTVQPLWNAHAAWFAGHPDFEGEPRSAMIDHARALTGFDGVDAGSHAIAFARPGMAITLNGVAQGYITDFIADLLRNEGFDHAMVELGETRALGAAPDGKPFEVGLMKPGAVNIIDRKVQLADASLSVSGGYGFRFGRSRAHHIFDPSSGLSPERLRDVAVIAPRATHADGLSTAIYVAGEAAAPRILASYPGARAILTRADGSVIQIG